jgi:hypothetical protein
LFGRAYGSAFLEPMKAEEVMDALLSPFRIATRATFKQDEIPSK